ncbi:MlaA family lipoprotein [Massilia sp. TWR1-2-2]|uniref:MlaA family lipoprotein n=1 Tax=Massilia sp. TWR1-2-2 TaxID=2804584 RepID=UPI003CF26571
MITATTSPARSSWRGIALVLAVSTTLAGCATGPNPSDPYEKFNRQMFKFNDAVDRVALKPAATAYKQVLPTFVQTGVSNFFGNLSDLWTGANNLMQGKGQDGMSDLTRFALNSTFGLVGVLDIASEAGLHKHNEDFGQTLGAWGMPSGPYLMLPLLGPSTVRDTVVMPIDIAADPWAYKDPVNWRNVGTGVRAIDQRAAVLDASNLMEEAALDRYEFIRDGFLQRRLSRITDNGDQKIKFKKGAQQEGKQDNAPADAKAIKAAYPDDPGATAPAAGKPAAPGAAAPAAAAAAAPAAAASGSEAKSIRDAYSDDPGPTPVAGEAASPAAAAARKRAPAAKKPVPAAAVSSETPSK